MFLTQKTKSLFACTVASLLTMTAVTVHAQDKTAAAKPEEKSLWETTAAAGFTLTSGNSDTLLGTASIETKRKWAVQDLSLGASAAYGENSSVKNVDNYQAFGQYNHTFLERAYFGLKLDFLRDEIADVNYRFTVSPLLGYYLIKKDNMLLGLEIGPSGVIEKQGGVSKTYFGGRVGERFEYKINERAKVWQKAEFIPQVDDLNNYVFNAEVGVDTAITTRVSLRVVLQDMYDNVPALGRKKNDLRLVSGVAYKF